MASERPAFRPNRTRASLSAFPSASTSNPLFPNNENRESTSTLSASTTNPTRKKRAQSLGGDALEGLRKRTKLETLRAEATMNFELSPNKADRRKAAPRRSILKSVGVVFDNNTVNFGSSARRPSLDPTSNTTDLSALSAFQKKSTRRRSSIKPLENPVERYDDSDQDEEEDDDDPNGSLDMDITRMDHTVAYDEQSRRAHRASHSRRVSFAPSANVRHFTPDKPTAEAQNAQAAREAAERAALELAERTGDTSFLSNTSGISAADLSDAEEEEEEDEDAIESEPSMEIAGDEVTLAFKGHFAGTQLPVSALQPEDEQEEDEVEPPAPAVGGEADEDGTQAMDEVTNDFTSQNLLQQQTQLEQPAEQQQEEESRAPKPNRPRFSTIVREEDDEDEEIMRSLGFAKGGKPRKSRVGLMGLGDVEEEGEDEEDMEEEEGEGSDMDADEDGTQAMEMTTAVGGIISQQQPVATEDSEDEEAESAEVSMQLIGGNSNNSNDESMDMVEATASYGSILSAPLPRPSLAPAPRLSSPLRARTASPPKSPAAPLARSSESPIVSRAQSVPPLGGAAPLGTPSKSPFRRSGGYGTPSSGRRMSALPSPRRVIAPVSAPVPQKSPARARSRSASPVKQGPFLPPSSLAGKSTHKVAQTPPPAGNRSSASPVKSAPRTMNNRPRPSFAAGRSPGGSLSLKGLMAQQQTISQPQPQPIDHVATGAEPDLNHTGSEFDASFDATPDGPQPPASIQEFFAATGTEFVSDFVGRSGGFDLNSSRVRRKSLAASAFGDDSKDRAPPTFADKVVAGACQLLMHDLYRNDQRLLLERLQETQGEYNYIDEYVQAGETPAVFRDWAQATDEEKINLKNRFAQMKLHFLVNGAVEWKATRNENMQQIVNAMEQRLDELRHDRAELEQFELESVLPSLEERHAALQAELLAEQTLDAELSSYTADQKEELAQLHADIEEQEEQINGNRSKGIPGARPQFERVEQQLQKDRTVLENEKEKEVATKERIVELEAALKDKRTKADLTRMKTEFETLQQLHGWTLTRFDSSIIQLRHFDELEVAFELDSSSSLNVANAEFGLVETKKWSNPLAFDVTAYLVGRIAEHVNEELKSRNRDPRVLLQLISSQTLVLRQIRHEISLASLSYPIHFSPTTQTLELEIYSSKARKAFLVSIPMSEIELDVSTDDHKSKWAEHLSAEIQVKFGGNIGSAGLAINERLNDCEGLLAALQAGEEVCAIAV
ncbi:uncharacterized protein JCM6883_001199 [Sporobolomyces salmoneus]|uniref:uncharacterized protein n=1 Tax=Sporobolomyces salmoneus TaxID=183962 RepID=UPI003173FC52